MRIKIAEKFKIQNLLKSIKGLNWDEEDTGLIGKIEEIVNSTEVSDKTEYEFILKIELLAATAGENSDKVIKTIEEPFLTLLEAKEVAESDYENALFWSNYDDGEERNIGNKLFTGDLGTVQYTIEKREKGEFTAEIAQASSKYIKENFNKTGRVVR